MATDSTRRRLIGGAIFALVLGAAIAMIARGSGGPPTSAEQAIEAEMRRLGMRPVGRCPADQPSVEDGACHVFIAQEGGQCSFATGPAGSAPDRLITIRQKDGGWETVAVTRLDFFLRTREPGPGACAK